MKPCLVYITTRASQTPRLVSSRVQVCPNPHCRVCATLPPCITGKQVRQVAPECKGRLPLRFNASARLDQTDQQMHSRLNCKLEAEPWIGFPHLSSHLLHSHQLQRLNDIMLKGICFSDGGAWQHWVGVVLEEDDRQKSENIWRPWPSKQRHLPTIKSVKVAGFHKSWYCRLVAKMELKDLGNGTWHRWAGEDCLWRQKPLWNRKTNHPT